MCLFPHQEPPKLSEDERICASKALSLIPPKSQAQGERSKEDKKNSKGNRLPLQPGLCTQEPGSPPGGVRTAPMPGQPTGTGLDEQLTPGGVYLRGRHRPTPPLQRLPGGWVGRTQAARTVTCGQVWAPWPFQLPAAVLDDLARQVPKGVSPTSPRRPGTLGGVSQPPSPPPQ